MVWEHLCIAFATIIVGRTNPSTRNRLLKTGHEDLYRGVCVRSPIAPMERAAALPSMGLLWAPVCRRVLIPLPARESKLQAALKPWKRLSQCHIRERQFRACYACWIARTSPGRRPSRSSVGH